ncbi:MAG: glutamate racemase [Ruminococcaceae bacterium]|nr:glutamate racemase [Oscillospiraceae bacterium]
MRNVKIGVFDSGLGGLTSVKNLIELLPGADLIYFGDTARVPYGSRSSSTIMKYAKQDISFLLEKNVDLVLAACATAGSVLEPAYTASLPVPYFDVIRPAAKAATSTTQNGKIGVISTEATLASGSFKRELQYLGDYEVFQVATPLFVPLIENGYIRRGNIATTSIAEDYLRQLKSSGIDTLILGCTHYPLISDIIGYVMGPNVNLIDSGAEAAKSIANHIVGGCFGNGSLRVYTSDLPMRFHSIASMFLGDENNFISEQVDIEGFPPYSAE